MPCFVQAPAPHAEPAPRATPACPGVRCQGYIASGGLPFASLLAVLVGLLELLGGLAIAFGFHARWAALALGLFTLAASVLFHQFWAVPADKAMIQQLMFMKNLSVAGGLFIVAALGAGPVSLDARRSLRVAAA